MKHRNPTRQHALLALLASLSLSGCQWDSVLYDSYIAAFGESGAGGFDTCENMEYILVRDTASGSNSSKRIERSLCCEDTDPCDPSAETLQKNPLCIAFKFDKCPLTASRCMVEKIIKEGLDHNLNPTYTEDFQTYCAEAICQPDEIECNIEFNWTEEINNTDDGVDTENIETTQSIDKKLRFFTCIDPTNNKTCGASCPPPTTIPSKDGIDLTNLSNYFINQVDCSSTNRTCYQSQNPNYSSNEDNSAEPQYLYSCNCPEHHINCDDKCIDPSSDEYCGITSCLEIDEDIHKCKLGSKCTNTQTNGKDAIYECKCPENTIECNGECINPDTDTRYCGASGTCQGENKGESCGADFTCINGTCHCKDGYTQCNSSPDNFSGRREPTCIPNNIQDNDPIKLQWKSLRFAPDGCNCLPGYTNEDNVTHPDDNGCEVAQTDTECGIVGINAVNCITQYHTKPSANKKDPLCVHNESDFLCNSETCNEGYNPVSISIFNNEYNRLAKLLASVTNEQPSEYLTHIGEKICLPNTNECCGSNCNMCEENTPVCIGAECNANPCQEPKTYSCFGTTKCMSAVDLNKLHILINTETLECRCEDDYEQVNGSCQPTPQKACELSSGANKYCFGQCLNEIQQKEAHIISDSTSCDCEEGYKKVLFGTVEVNNPTPPDTNTNIDNSIPGYCQKTESSNHTPYSCNGKNCYEMFPYANPKDVKCKKNDNDKGGNEYSCYFDKCLDGYFLYTPKDTSKPNRCLREGYYFDSGCVSYCNDCKDGDTCNIYSNWLSGCYAASCD